MDFYSEPNEGAFNPKDTDLLLQCSVYPEGMNNHGVQLVMEEDIRTLLIPDKTRVCVLDYKYLYVFKFDYMYYSYGHYYHGDDKHIYSIYPTSYKKYETNEIMKRVFKIQKLLNQAHA